jgi:hypothetical protein
MGITRMIFCSATVDGLARTVTRPTLILDMHRIRKLTRDQHEALVAIDAEERSTIELELLEADHLAAEDAYLRRKDRLLGREVQPTYPEIESQRAVLARETRRRQERFDAARVAVLTGARFDLRAPSQLVLLPDAGEGAGLQS